MESLLDLEGGREGRKSRLTASARTEVLVRVMITEDAAVNCCWSEVVSQ